MRNISNNFPAEFEAFMREKDFHIRESINYNLIGKFQRFSDARKARNKKDIYIILHPNEGATFGDWHYPENYYTYWAHGNVKPTAYDIKDRQEAIAESKRLLRLEQSLGEGKAKEYWNKSYLLQYTDDHPYVKKKRIRAYYSCQADDLLLIPIRDIDYQFRTLQTIDTNGFKKFWESTSPKDLMTWLSEPLPYDYAGVIRICEGYATGCTIYEAIGSPVVCALSAQNLVSVAVQLRKKFPNANLRLCADNDQWGKENIGLKYAMDAHNSSNAPIYFPNFTSFYPQQNTYYGVVEKPTDFNDLMCLAGIEEVEKQLIRIRK